MICTFAILVLASLANAHIRDIIGQRLEKGLQYLENNRNLDVNGTFSIVIAAGQLIYLKKTSKTLTIAQKDGIDNWKERMQAFIDYQKETELDYYNYDVQTFFYPEDWVNNGDYTFVKGEVSGPASQKSVTEIYGATLKYDQACDQELYSNTKSIKKRSCGISNRCKEVIMSTEEEGSVSPRERLIYLVSMNYLKCSEYPDNYYDITKGLCNLLYKQILKLTEHGYIQNKAYFYMDKVLLCGTLGFTEFCIDDILKTLMDQQNEDGSIGTQPKEEKKLLTAQYVAILSSAYRLEFGTGCWNC